MDEDGIALFVARAFEAALDGHEIVGVEVDNFEQDDVLACAMTRQGDSVAWLSFPRPSFHLDQAERILTRRLRLFGVIQ